MGASFVTLKNINFRNFQVSKLCKMQSDPFVANSKTELIVCIYRISTTTTTTISIQFQITVDYYIRLLLYYENKRQESREANIMNGRMVNGSRFW